MIFPTRLLRAAAAYTRTRALFFALAFTLVSNSAHAVIVRGRVTDALGKAIPGARVQLIEAGKVAAIGYATADGTYEIRYADAGRFTLLGSAGGFLPGIGAEFYGGATDVVEHDVVLSAVTVQQEVSVTATGFPTPLPQLTAPVTVVTQNDLATRVGVVDEMRQAPGVFLDQTGQAGSVTSLFVRGGPSDGNKVLIDGIPAEDVGGSFDFGTVASTGITTIELYRGPNSALVGSDSQASVVAITTPQGLTLKPMLTYSGDAGTLHSYRNEAILSGTAQRFDYLAGFSRSDTSNALPNDQFHSETAVANLGYHIFHGADARFTLRYAPSAEGLPNAYDFYNLTLEGKQGDQDLYSGLTLEDRTDGGWHNLLRYGIARKREQANYFTQSGTYNPADGNYYGNVVTVRGANGYTTTGQAAIYENSYSDYNQDSNRDELYYQSDYVFPHRIGVLFGFRYDNERGSFNYPGYDEYESIQRPNFEYDLQVTGDIVSRLFYSFGGSIQKNHLYGLAGEPRLGLAYVPVRPSSRPLHGTKLRLSLATGVQEPSLADEYGSLYRQLLSNGDPQDVAAYNIQPIGPERSRTLDLGLDQNILANNKLILHLDYFHNQFSHQIEYVYANDLATYFGFTPTSYAYLYGADMNSMAYRAEGAEAALEWRPFTRLFVRGGYTYLDAKVEQSYASDATAMLQGYPDTNPNFPNIPIGNYSPFVGARPFRRPPNTGFVNVLYSRPKWSVVLQSSMASRADDSTYLGGDSPGYGNALLLPNRDLDFSYVKLDLGGTYAFRKNITVFAQVDNLLNDQHIGPIGYPSLPLTARAGLKLRLGGD